MTETTSETRVLDAVLEMNVVSLESVRDLDPETLLLVRLAGLIAADAPPMSYMVHLAAATETEITESQVEDVLLALAPVVGSARIASAATNIARAIGIVVLGSESDDDINLG